MKAYEPVVVVLLLSLTACASNPPPEAFVHPEYAARRPAMMAISVEGPASIAGEVREAVYAGLIALDYTVLVPDEPPGPGVGKVKVVIAESEPQIEAVLSVFDPREDRLYRAGAKAKTAAELAERLLRRLPRK